MPALARANLLAAACETVDGSAVPPQMIAEWIEQLARLIQSFSTQDIIRDINEEDLTNFPLVKDGQVEIQLAEHQRYYRDTLKDMLDKAADTGSGGRHDNRRQP